MWGIYDDFRKGNYYRGEKLINRNRFLDRVNSKGYFRSCFKCI